MTAPIVVVGGGPAGLAAAIALGERGFCVVVVDQDHSSPALARCEMLSAGAREIMARLGLNDVLAKSVPLNGVVSKWDDGAPIDHGAALSGLAGFGWSVDRRELDRAMRERLSTLGIDVITARVQGVRGQFGAWKLALSTGDVLEACYCVDASGRAGVIARRLGGRVKFGPDIVALTCNIDTPVPHNLIAEATPDGWWYALPRSGGGGSVGFLTSQSRCVQRPKFLEAAAASLTLVPKPVGHVDVLISDSRMARLETVYGDGWLATGDASAAFDPIASQGLFNALSGGFFGGNAAADTVLQDAEAAQIYAALIARTADRTHRLTPFQYGGGPYDTPFWKTIVGAQYGSQQGALHGLR